MRAFLLVFALLLCGSMAFAKGKVYLIVRNANKDTTTLAALPQTDLVKKLTQDYAEPKDENLVVRISFFKGYSSATVSEFSLSKAGIPQQAYNEKWLRSLTYKDWNTFEICTMKSNDGKVKFMTAWEG